MTNKNLRLGIVLFVLILAAYIYKGPYESWRNNQNMPDNFFSTISLDDIDKIEVSNINATAGLLKEDEKWKIEGTKDFYVKDESMKQIFDSLKLAQDARVETVSTNPDNKGDFLTNEPGADSGQGIQVSLHGANGELLSFIVGKMALDFVSTYISMPDTDKTYSVKANLRTAFDQYDWRDNVIFAVDRNAVAKIRFQYPDREFTIEKKIAEDGAETWVGTAPNEFSVNNEKAVKIVGIMSNLKALKIPAQSFDGTGLEKNSVIVQASGEGVDNVIMIGDKNSEDLYYVKRGDSDNIYLVEESVKEQLDLKIDDLK